MAFLGLTGTQGVLPFCYTEWMLERKAAKDDTLAAFLDLFNHRLISFFYRAWEKHRPPVLYELGAARDQQPDAFTHSLYDLIGMGTEGLLGRMRIHDESLLLYAGLIAQRPHSASALRGILRDYFDVPVEIDQCVGDWYELDETDRCYLSPETGTQSTWGECISRRAGLEPAGPFPDSRRPGRPQPLSGFPAPRTRHGQTGAIHPVPGRSGHGVRCPGFSARA